MRTKITVLRIPARGSPFYAVTDPATSALQSLVATPSHRGFLTTFPLVFTVASETTSYVLYCHDEGRLHKLPSNDNFPAVRGSCFLSAVNHSGDDVGIAPQAAKYSPSELLAMLVPRY